MIRDFVEIGDFTTLDQLIERLTELREGMPAGAEAEFRICGNEAYGRHLCVGFMRPLTAEEAACEGRYRDPDEREYQAAA